jgi:23S rRNA G2069 N7-methylase RlmK/C1962 C5-methylase RlmI
MIDAAPSPAIRLRVPGSRHHLFFFRKMVVKPETFIEAGTVVDVVDRGGANLGCGFTIKSEIAVRMLGVAEENLIEKRPETAVRFRESLKIEADAYRVCHLKATGCRPVVDRYAGVHRRDLSLDAKQLMS